MTAPERIYMKPNDMYENGWARPIDTDQFDEEATEYVRADLAAVQPAHGVWNKCTFDLSGAGYDCVLKDGDARHGAYGDGQKVFWDGTTINAEGLYILSKPALDKRIAAAHPAQVRPDPRDEVIGLPEITEEMITAGRNAADDYYFKWRGLGARKEGEGLDGMHFIVREALRAALAAAKEVMK